MTNDEETGDGSRTEQAKRGIDPTTLEPGDEVHVLQDGETVATGTVQKVDPDAVPCCVWIEDEDGAGWAWFVEAGRTFVRADDDALDIEEALELLEGAVGTITDNVASGRLYGETVEELHAALDTVEAALIGEGGGANTFDVVEALAGEGRVEVDRISRPEERRTALDTPQGELLLDYEPDSSSKEGSNVTRFWQMGPYRIGYSIDRTPGNPTHTVRVVDRRAE